MIFDAIVMLGSIRFAAPPWGAFVVLLGLLPLIVILFAISAVVRGPGRRGNGLAVFCLTLMLGAFALLWVRVRPGCLVRVVPPAWRAAISARVEAPEPPPLPRRVEKRVEVAEGGDPESPAVTVTIDDGDGAASIALATHQKHRLPHFLKKLHPNVLWTVVTACAIGALMFVGYIALDAGTRGQFTWPLRVLSVLCFGAIITTVVALRHAL